LSKLKWQKFQMRTTINKIILRMILTLSICIFGGPAYAVECDSGSGSIIRIKDWALSQSADRRSFTLSVEMLNTSFVFIEL